MLGLQTTRRSQALANGADRQGATVQHAKRGIAERVDTFGVKVLLQQATEHVANSLVRGAFPDDHEYPRIGIGKQTRWSAGSGGTTIRDFAIIRRLHQLRDSFRNLPHGRPILLCCAKNEGMLEGGVTKALMPPADGGAENR